MTKQHRAMLQMLCCAILWSLSGVLIKLIPWNALAISGGRCIFSALVLFGYMRWKRMPIVWNRRALLLAFSVVMIYICYTPAVKMTTAANAIVLQYTAPVYVLLFGALFHKKKIKRADLLAVCITVAGMALCFFDQLSGGGLLGNILALISGVFLGLQFFAVEGNTEQERLSGLLIAQLASVLIGIPFFFKEDVVLTGSAVFFVVVLGVLQLGIPYLLYVQAARHCSSLSCSLIAVIEPMLNPIWVFLAIGEQPSAFALVGAAVVLCTVTAWNIWDERQRRKPGRTLA